MAPNHQNYSDSHMNRNLQKFLQNAPSTNSGNNQNSYANINNNRNNINNSANARNNLNNGNSRRLRVGSLRGNLTRFSMGRDVMLDRAIERLDPDLRPIPPQPSCPQSVQIYEDHRMMAAEFLDVQKEIADMTRYREELMKRLADEEEDDDDSVGQVSKRESSPDDGEGSPEEPDPEEVEKLVRLQAEKEALLQFQEKLSTQLQLIKKAKNKQQEQLLPKQQLSSEQASCHNQVSNNQRSLIVPQPRGPLPTTRSVEDGWVLIQENS